MQRGNEKKNVESKKRVMAGKMVKILWTILWAWTCDDPVKN